MYKARFTDLIAFVYNMSSESSDAEDERVKQFMEAADTNLLKDALFQQSTEESDQQQGPDEPKSQRYLLYETAAKDFLVSEATQQHFYKKLTEIISKQIEYCSFAQATAKKLKKRKNRIKLLSDADCYVKPYEDIEDNIKGPTKKPELKRRIVDAEDQAINPLACLESCAIDVNALLQGEHIKHWAKKPVRADKYFCYKTSKKGVAVYQEPENEFTKLRKKNQWHESKIKRKK